MFAHEVIAYLEDGIKNATQRVKGGQRPTEDAVVLLKLHQCFIEKIKIAQKFHFGDVDDVEKIQFFKTNDELMKLDLVSGLRLPYKIMWIDFTLKRNSVLSSGWNDLGHICNSKEGILVSGTEDIWEVVFFTYSAVHKSWLFVPINFMILPKGKDGPGFELLRHLTGSWSDKNRDSFFDKFNPSSTTFPIPHTSWAWEHMSSCLKGCDLNIALLQTAITLLNCKNIITTKIKAPDLLNKKRRRLGKQELFDYHVLDIVLPPKNKYYKEKSEPLSHNRIHLCRGHFKKYTAERPLFGRNIGLYWWPAALRGQNKDGMVIKDYSCKPVPIN